MRSKRKGEDLKMDEASIVNALQEDLQNYKVKAQIRRKESQLHVLISRAEGDDVDYASLYNIVKRCIDRLPIEGADSLVVYGRLAGAKHPEWQKKADIRPPLPLIELDLDELEEFNDIGELGNLAFPPDNDETFIQVGNLEPIVHKPANSFENSIENKLTPHSIEITNEDFNLGDLDLGKFKLDNIEQNDLEQDSLELDTFELNNYEPIHRSPVDKNSLIDEDFSSDETMVAMPMPLPPPPPLPPVKRSLSKVVADIETNAPPKKTTYPAQKSLLLSGALIVMAIGILGLCGWLVWDRSVQQRYLANARSFDTQNLNPKTITKLESLTETRNQLQTAISELEEIPDRPASLYTDAQTELTALRPKLTEFDRKINTEQVANKKLESAKNGTLDAAKLVQNPPHKSTVWKSAQEQRQQAVKLLEEIPTDSLQYSEAQKYLKAYRTELVQITKRVEIQQRAETSAGNINPTIATQLKQLKAKASEKQQFLPQCKTILQPQISNAEAQRVGFPVVTLTEYLCAYYWDS